MHPKAHVIRYCNEPVTIGVQLDEWSTVLYRLTPSEARELVKQVQQALKDAKTKE